MKIKNPKKKISITTAIIPPEDAELMVSPKSSCNKCYGRGYQLWIAGNGYKLEDKLIPRLQTGIGAVVQYDSITVRTEDLQRVSRPCPCTFRHARFKLSAAATKAKFRKKLNFKSDMSAL